MTARRDTHLIPSLLTICLGVFLVWKGLSMPHERGWSSSPGLFPIIIGAVLIFLAILLLVERQKLRKADDARAEAEQGPLDFKVVGLVAGSLAVYVLALGYLPYEPPTFVYLVLAMWAFGNRSIPIILASSLAFTLLISVLFTQVLGTLVPGTHSILDFLLY